MCPAAHFILCPLAPGEEGIEEEGLLPHRRESSGRDGLAPLASGLGWLLCALCGCLGEHMLVHQLRTDASSGGLVLPSQVPQVLGKQRHEQCHQMWQVPHPEDGEGSKQGVRISEGFVGEAKSLHETLGGKGRS